ncbi:MAG: hypothetical protein R6V77_03130 [Candidatus Cloacimonadaceae bacterium]
MLFNPDLFKQTQEQGPQQINLKLEAKLKLKWAILISVVLLLLVLYLNLPVLSYKFAGTYFALAFVLLPMVFNAKTWKVVKYIYLLLGLIFLIMFIATLPILRAKAYRSLIGKIESTPFTKLVSPIDLNQIPVVDRTFASMLAEKKLGEDFALGSRVTMGWPTRQIVNEELIWVIPLLHSGFFKWLTNLEGTPAYIVVSATNPQDVRFVRDVQGNPVRIKYQPNAFFQHDLHRHLYMHGYVLKGLTDFTFELNDEGSPFWTAKVFNKNIGFSGNDADGIAMVNPESGVISYYPKENVPIWVDRINPADYVLSQLNWWGNYVHGFWNTVFGKRDMLMATDGYNIIYGNDNRCYFYTGMSSVGSDEGAVGFVLVDTRTKTTNLYKLSGATEFAAIQSAEGKVQNFRYRATFPILINVSGLPTYFVTLKDNAGLVKMYAMVSVRDYSVVGVGETVKGTRDSYMMVLSSTRAGILPDTAVVAKTQSGTVTRIGNDVRDGRTYYYLSLVEMPGKIVVANSDLSSELPITQKGDQVEIGFIASDDNEINLNSFKNTSMK